MATRRPAPYRLHVMPGFPTSLHHSWCGDAPGRRARKTIP